MPSSTNLEGEEIMDPPGKDGKASMSEWGKRPNPWRKMKMMYMHNHCHQATAHLQLNIIIIIIIIIIIM
jgi:hypothetical protein